MPKRPKRKMGPRRGYRPSGEPEGYEPARRTRKAPRAYWRRNPYPDEFGGDVSGAPQPLPPREPVDPFDFDWS